MKLQIIGDGAFGSFLKELLSPHFELCDDAFSVVLAVPISAYDDVASKNKNKHLINVCSVQKPSTEICLKYSLDVTSIHPLFGRRTPTDKRNSIITHQSTAPWISAMTAERCFLNVFQKVSKLIINDANEVEFTPESHDLLMFKTHFAAARAAQEAKKFIDMANDVPDEFIPNSFRLLREFVKTMEDMPKGTMESILANPFANL
jgi:prephenate dehydrogenase